jgi:4-amino-4-deoxy-L-arabinose transferase-like glycosyltransferase
MKKQVVGRFLEQMGVLALLLLAFGLRAYGLERSGFWIDEGLTAVRTGYSVGEILTNVVVVDGVETVDTVPAFYYLITHFARQLWGDSDFALRNVSVLLGVILLPLLYQWGRKLGGRQVALWAMALGAVNPLWIWYAQEARMYMLLLVLGVAGTFCLYSALGQAALSPRHKGVLPPLPQTRSGGHVSKGGEGFPAIIKWFVWYLVFAVLSLYTHYLSVFLLAGQALFWVWVLWQRGYKRLIVGGAIVGAIMAVLIAPFTIPRLFTGAEAGYFYVSPLEILRDLGHGFSLGVTADYGRWWIKLLDLGVLVILGTGVWRVRGLSRWFLLVCMLATVAGIVIVSPLKPIYQGVRHILVGSPAFLLLLAVGIIGTQIGADGRGFSGKVWRVGALVWVFVGAGVSLGNLYFEQLYVKDDIRGLIAYVDETAGGHDVVVYNDAILLLLHDHYATREDIPVLALPIYPLFFDNGNTAEQLDMLTATYDRIWFMVGEPPQERDAGERVRAWLGDNLALVHERNAHGRTREVRVEVYETGQPNSEVVASALDWASLPTLNVVPSTPSDRYQTPTIWFDLDWAGDNIPRDTELEIRLQNPVGQEWATEIFDVWLADGTLRPSLFTFVPFGSPRGAYTVQLRPFSAENGGHLGDWQTVATVTLAGSLDWIAPVPSLGNCPLTFEDGTVLHQVVPAGAVKPGNPLPVALYWGDVVGADKRYVLEMVAEDGTVVRTEQGRVVPDWLFSVEADTVLLTKTGISVAGDVLPGRYTLRWQLLEYERVLGGRTCWQPFSTPKPEFGEVVVEAWDLVTELPAFSTPIEANFGDTIQLHSYDIEQTDVLNLSLAWQAQAIPPENYKVFVHLRDSQNEIAGQCDFIPGNWLRPTKSWRENEVIVDKCEIGLPENAGTYTLYTGLYDPNTFARPTVVVNGEAQVDNQLLLDTITIP